MYQPTSLNPIHKSPNQIPGFSPPIQTPTSTPTPTIPVQAPSQAPAPARIPGLATTPTPGVRLPSYSTVPQHASLPTPILNSSISQYQPQQFQPTIQPRVPIPSSTAKPLPASLLQPSVNVTPVFKPPAPTFPIPNNKILPSPPLPLPPTTTASTASAYSQLSQSLTAFPASSISTPLNKLNTNMNLGTHSNTSAPITNNYSPSTAISTSTPPSVSPASIKPPSMISTTAPTSSSLTSSSLPLSSSSSTLPLSSAKIASNVSSSSYPSTASINPATSNLSPTKPLTTQQSLTNSTSTMKDTFSPTASLANSSPSLSRYPVNQISSGLNTFPSTNPIINKTSMVNSSSASSTQNPNIPTNKSNSFPSPSQPQPQPQPQPLTRPHPTLPYNNNNNNIHTNTVTNPPNNQNIYHPTIQSPPSSSNIAHPHINHPGSSAFNSNFSSSTNHQQQQQQYPQQFQNYSNSSSFPPSYPPSNHYPPTDASGDLPASNLSSTATTPYTSGQNTPINTGAYNQSHYPPPLQNNSNTYNNSLNGAGSANNNNVSSLDSSAQSSPVEKKSKKVDRIDPKQIPRPNDSRGSLVQYNTRSGLAPPSAVSDYVVIDEGNCSPRFIRMTTNNIAHEQELIDSTKLCIGAIIQPLACLGDGEEPIPIVELPNGPVRCGRCRAYVNPFFTWTDNGSSFLCNICGMKNETPSDYQCNLDADGNRRDRNERPELCRGSVEYSVGAEFLTRPIHPPSYLFILDISYYAVVSGLTNSSIQAIQQTLDVLVQTPNARVGVVTYDTTIHFYSLLPGRSDSILYVMSDIDDVFIPCPSEEILIPLASTEHRNLLDALLERLTQINPKSSTNGGLSTSSQLLADPEGDHGEMLNGPAFGAAVGAAVECLFDTGGKVMITLSGLPSVGVGKLSNRDNSSLYYTDKEKSLMVPQSAFYQTLATKAAERAISIDLFLAANSYVDLSTIGVLSEKTGGQLFNYPAFNSIKDGNALCRDIYHDCTRLTGFDGVMIVRVSTGLRVAEHFGNFFHRSASEMDLPSIDSDKTFAVRLEHESALKDKSEAVLQCALLYTTTDGNRRIRVHTLSLPVTNVMSNIFRYSDLDAIINLSLKQAVRQLLDSTTPTEAQNALTSACIDSLFVYRKFCASATSAGQLILPEPLKLLPLSTLGLIKHPLFQEGVAADERAFLYQFVNSMPCYVSVAFVCPRLYSLHDMPSTVAATYQHQTSDNGITSGGLGVGKISLPPSLTLSSESIVSNGIYLLDDARFLYFYIGSDVDNDLLSSILDFSSSMPILKQSEDPTSFAGRIERVIDTLRQQKSHFQNVQHVSRRSNKNDINQVQNNSISRSNSSLTLSGESLDESIFFAHLIEDSGRGRGAIGLNQRNGAISPSFSGNAGNGMNGDYNTSAGVSGKKDSTPANAMSYIDFLCWIHKKIQAKFCHTKYI